MFVKTFCGRHENVLTELEGWVSRHNSRFDSLEIAQSAIPSSRYNDKTLTVIAIYTTEDGKELA